MHQSANGPGYLGKWWPSYVGYRQSRCPLSPVELHEWPYSLMEDLKCTILVLAISWTLWWVTCVKAVAAAAHDVEVLVWVLS